MSFSLISAQNKQTYRTALVTDWSSQFDRNTRSMINGLLFGVFYIATDQLDYQNVKVDSLQSLLSDDLTSIHGQFSPQKLAEVRQKVPVDVLVFAKDIVKSNAFYLSLKAVDFISGKLIGQTDVSFDTTMIFSNRNQIQNAFTNLLVSAQEGISKMTELNTGAQAQTKPADAKPATEQKPIQKPQTKTIIPTRQIPTPTLQDIKQDNIAMDEIDGQELSIAFYRTGSQEAMSRQIDLFRSVYSSIDLNIKPILRTIIFDWEGASCQEMIRQNQQQNVLLSFAIIEDNQMHIVFNPTDFKQPIINVSAPVRPVNDEINCLVMPYSQGALEKVLYSLFSPKEDISNLANSGSQQIVWLFNRVAAAHRQFRISRDADLYAIADDGYYLLKDWLSDQPIASIWIEFNHGDLKYLAGHADEAFAMIKNVETAFLTNNVQAGVILSRLEMADLHVQNENYDQAQTFYYSVLDHAKSIRDSLSMAHLDRRLAMLFEVQGFEDQAFQYYSESASLFTELKKPFFVAQMYGHMSSILRNQNELDRAEYYAAHYFDLANQVKSEPDIANAALDLGIIYLKKEQVDKAIDRFTLAANEYDNLADSLSLAYVFSYMGIANKRLKKYQIAQTSFQSATHLFDQLNQTTEVIRMHRVLGDVLALQKKWEEAHEYYDQALYLAYKSQKPDEITLARYRKGMAYMNQGMTQMGYTEIKKAVQEAPAYMANGAESKDAFLKKLDNLMAEIQDLYSMAKN